MLLNDVAVIRRDGVTIYVDVLRPAGAEKVPVIVAWSPYGKGQGTSRSVMGVFGLVGLDNGIVSRFDRITVPAYVVASYSNTLHTAGTFRAWRRMASEEKWLRIHNSQEWLDYYDEANRGPRRRARPARPGPPRPRAAQRPGLADR